MASIKKWLAENNFNFKAVEMNDGRKGLMVDTNYEGYYPTKETWTKQQAILNKVRKFKGLQAESRGYNTAVLITLN